MLWFTVWTLLVLGALATFALLGRDLWRKGRRFMTEAGRAAELLETLETQVAELEGTLPLSSPAPVELQDPGPAHERRALALVDRERRRRARAARHESTYRRWRSLSR
jgi:hypothetical protein